MESEKLQQVVECASVEHAFSLLAKASGRPAKTIFDWLLQRPSVIGSWVSLPHDRRKDIIQDVLAS